MNQILHHKNNRPNTASLCIRLAVAILITIMIASSAIPACSYAATKASDKTNGDVRTTDSIKSFVKHGAGATNSKKIRSIRLSGNVHLRPGHSSKLKVAISPSTAARKKLKWTSSNSKVAKVSASGKVTALKKGTCKIKAKALDGSGTVGAIKVTVFSLKKSDTLWVAHRGLWSQNVPENTAKAFRLAGKNGFWGCECDVWETAHTASESIVGGQAGAFDIVVNHDENFSRIWGLDKRVKDMTAEEIRATPDLSRVCFLQEYLDICLQYGMVPVIELKDPGMSQEALERIADMVYETGTDVQQSSASEAGTVETGTIESGTEVSGTAGTVGKTLLAQTLFVSYFVDKPVQIRDYIQNRYGVIPVTSLIIGKNQFTGTLSELQEAKAKGYTGVSLNKVLLSGKYSSYCHDNGLQLHVWTYKNTSACDEMLYQQIVQKKYGIASYTTNGKLFK